MLTMLVLERVSPGLRGELTKWLLELQPGVFVGDISSGVRAELWEVVQRKIGHGAAATLVHPAATAQGLTFAVAGAPGREVVDHEGLLLIRRPLAGTAKETQ